MLLWPGWTAKGLTLSGLRGTTTKALWHWDVCWPAHQEQDVKQYNSTSLPDRPVLEVLHAAVVTRHKAYEKMLPWGLDKRRKC